MISIETVREILENSKECIRTGELGLLQQYIHPVYLAVPDEEQKFNSVFWQTDRFKLFSKSEFTEFSLLLDYDLRRITNYTCMKGSETLYSLFLSNDTIVVFIKEEPDPNFYLIGVTSVICSQPITDLLNRCGFSNADLNAESSNHTSPSCVSPNCVSPNYIPKASSIHSASGSVNNDASNSSSDSDSYWDQYDKSDDEENIPHAYTISVITDLFKLFQDFQMDTNKIAGHLTKIAANEVEDMNILNKHAARIFKTVASNDPEAPINEIVDLVWKREVS